MTLKNIIIVPMRTEMDQPILIYDGTCALCNKAVQFVLAHEQEENLLFTSSQSPQGEHLLREGGLLHEAQLTLILYDSGKYFLRSEAVLKTAWYMGGKWKNLKLLRVFPLWLRDWAYNRMAMNRLWIFGTSNDCVYQAGIDSQRFLQSLKHWLRIFGTNAKFLE